MIGDLLHEADGTVHIELYNEICDWNAYDHWLRENGYMDWPEDNDLTG